MTARQRGQPLVALGLVMIAWVGLRAWGPIDALLEVPLPLPPTVKGRVEPLVPPPTQPQVRSVGMVPIAIAPPVPTAPLPVASPTLVIAPPLPAVIGTTTSQLQVPTPFAKSNVPPPAPRPAVIMPFAAVPFGAVPAEVRAGRRWSSDSWILWREKGRPGSALIGGGTYGASQAGAVVRYRIAPGSRFDPRAYLRVTSTLSPEYEVEGAAGIAVRPLARVPLDIMVEGRTLHFFGDARLRPSETRVRPAVMAVAGPPALKLPGQLRAEAYGQVGYVGGEGSSTFADGQLRVIRNFTELSAGPMRFEGGLGTWGGAQKGVHRVDVGPTAAMTFPVGKTVFGRVSLDWRQRVSGSAEPGSGPVFTVSAGF